MELISLTKPNTPLLKEVKVKSPLRYPGGKSRALKQILPIIHPFEEFREPMVGGGSVFFAIKQLFPNKRFWINDINRDLYLFWIYCKFENKELSKAIKNIKDATKDGHALFLELTNTETNFADFERATRFFVLNRITFSGTVDSGGFSKQAFEKRFTNSSIQRMINVKPVLKDTQITNGDYEQLINAPGEEVFIFLDPPYLSTKKSRLYGKNGDLHSFFDHERFSRNLRRCNHNWLVTYDNSPEIKKLFSFANIYEWELQYGMNNYKQESASKGREIFISNYEIPSLSDKKIS